MPNDPNNGGKRINQLEQKDAVQDVTLEFVVKQIAEMHDILAKLDDKMDESFGMNGFCVRHQRLVIRHDEQIKSNNKWIKAMWGLGVAILGIGIKAAFFA